MSREYSLDIVDQRTGQPLLKTKAEREVAKKIVDILEPLSKDSQRAALQEMAKRIRPADTQSFLDQIRSLPLGQQRAAARAALPLAQEQAAQSEQKLQESHAKLAALRACKDWLETNPSRLESPRGSVWHKLLEARQAGRVLYIPKDDEGRAALFFEHQPQVFVVEHNWAAAFSGADDFAGGSFRLPFDLTCFEFKTSGRRLCLMLRQDGDQHERLCLFQTEPYWVCYPPAPPDDPRRAADPMAPGDRLPALGDLLYSNVRAVCIAMDAEVAVSEAIRAPTKLNAARERKGKPLLSNYHVISLARRSRVVPMERGNHDEPKRRVRLHFRRGHWRHYETHRTWIKWQLVGNPDLGFIDKHYRL